MFKQGLYLILSEPVAGYLPTAQAAVEAQVPVLQLRIKTGEAEEKKAIASEIRALTAGTKTHFIINDDLALAMEVDADGLHVGQDDLSIQNARAQWNQPSKLIGLSTHNLQQALAAEDLGADYIGLGPIYPTQSKLNPDPTIGIEAAGQILSSLSIPVVAIGGIGLDQMEALSAQQFRSFAVIGAVNQAADPALAIGALQAKWKSLAF